MGDQASEAAPGQSGSGTKKPGFVPTAPPTTLATGSRGQSTDTTRGVWYLRPQQEQPYITYYAPYSTREDMTVSTYYDASDLEGAYGLLDQNQKRFFELVAKSDSSRGTGSGLFGRLLKEAERQNATGDNRVGPFDLVSQIALNNGLITEDGSFTDEGKRLARDVFGGEPARTGSSRGGYSGPVTTNALMDEQSAEMLLNGLATDMLGRNLTRKELSKYTAQFRQQEMANPTVTTSTQSSQTSVQGMADEDIARTILQDNPAFADNVLKTDVLDMFFNRIGGQDG